MYHPQLGTFLTRDPLAEEGQPDLLSDNNWFGRWLDMMKNLYGYANDNPVNATDPLGLFVTPPPPLLPLVVAGGVGVGVGTVTATYVTDPLVERLVKWWYVPDTRLGKEVWKGSCKARGTCPPGCGVFQATGPSQAACEQIAFQNCVEAGCNTPGCKPYNCQCGHCYCIRVS